MTSATLIVGSTTPTTPAAGERLPVKVNADGRLEVMVGTSATLDVTGSVAHDAAGTGVDPVLVGGYASAAAPADVSGDGDAVRAWLLRNGAQAAQLTAAGALIGGDAANGLDVDVTRLPVTFGAGAVAATTPRVTLASDDPAVASLQALDDWDESDRCKVNPIAGQVGVAGGSGVVGATTQRVVLATDVALPAGTNNIGDVDVLTLPAITGGKSSNGAVPGATNLGTLPAVANAAVPTHDEGRQVALRTNLAGDLAVTLDGEAVVLGAGTAAIGTATVVGAAAHDAPVSGAPVRVGARARTSNVAAVANDDAADLIATLVGALVNKPYSIPEADWSYAAASGGILNTTTAVTVKTAAAAGIRNYVTGLQVMAEALGTATELAIRDGAGGAVLWRTKIGTGGLVNGLSIEFPSPLRGSAATLLEVVTLTASGTGAVFINLQGYEAP